MFRLGWPRKFLLNESDPLASYRDRIVRPVGIAGLLLLGPFAVNNFVRGRAMLGLTISLVLVVMAVDVLAVWRGKTPPVHYGLTIAPMAVAILLSVVQQGFPGALWAYPVVLICYFMVPRRLALLFSLAILALVTAFVVRWADPSLAPRLFVTLLLSITMINVVLNVIGELQDVLVGQAITDPLTGAFNRRNMVLRLDEVVEQGRRRAPTNALLLLDLDHFKAINDRFGHDAGDLVLRRVVDVLASRKRSGDLLFRIGGEEFMLLLMNADAANAALVAEDLRRRVELAPLLAGHGVTISIGLASQRAGQSADDWVKRADTALYAAKKSGRNRVEIAAAAP